jgi:hypothetical protein
MNPSQKIWIMIALVPAMLIGCGAPTRSAGDVAGLFAGSGRTIGERVGEICSLLRERSASPNLEDVKLSDADCQDAGKSAQNYKEVKEFAFQGISKDSVAGEKVGESVLRVHTRGQFWLNHSLLGLAGLMASALEGQAAAEVGVEKTFESSSGNNEMANIAKASTTLLRKPEFNRETMEFSTAIKLKLKGLLTAENDLEIAGKLVDNAIAVRVETTEKTPYEKSLFEGLTVVAIVVPYAGDVYVDLSFDFRVHSVGLDSVVATQVGTALGGIVKNGLDGLLQLKK